MGEESTQESTQTSTWTPKKGKVERVRIPLPSEIAAQKAAAATAASTVSAAAASTVSAAVASTVSAASAEPASSADAAGVNAAFVRAENEDDDGYDPYSDRVEVTPFFESDPWS